MFHPGPHVLVVADCEGLEEMVNDLRRHGFEAEAASTGAAAMASYASFDVVLIDLDLTDFDGLTLCREIRNASDIPMIGFASLRELDRVLALEGGCDDCIAKPYRSRELMARLEALLRRVRMTTQPTLSAGKLEICPALREVRLGDQPVELTRKEFELLRLLAGEPDKVFTRAELLRRIWAYDNVGEEVTSLASRTIDTHLSSIRKKLGSAHWIITVRGVGFRFNEDTPEPDPADAGRSGGATG